VQWLPECGGPRGSQKTLSNVRCPVERNWGGEREVDHLALFSLAVPYLDPSVWRGPFQ
jgi:hypothetical protein